MAAESMNHLIVLDTETSGLDPKKHQILTLDAAALQRDTTAKDSAGWRAVGNPFHIKIAFQSWAEVDESALAVDHIVRKIWKGEEHEPVVVTKLVDWVRKTTGGSYRMLAGYNVGFDRDFLWEMFQRVRLPGDTPNGKWTQAFSYRRMDVMQQALFSVWGGVVPKRVTGQPFGPKRVVPYVPSFKLADVAAALRLNTAGAHSSSADVRMATEVMLRLWGAKKPASVFPAGYWSGRQESLL